MYSQWIKIMGLCAGAVWILSVIFHKNSSSFTSKYSKHLKLFDGSFSFSSLSSSSKKVNYLKLFGPSEFEDAKLEYPMNESLCKDLTSVKPSIIVCTHDIVTDEHVSTSIQHNAYFEWYMAPLIKDSLNLHRGAVFLDLGANLAQHSLYASAAMGALVWAVEPLAMNIVKIYRSVQLQGKLQNFTLIHNALDSERVQLRIRIGDRNIGASRVIANDSLVVKRQEFVDSVLLSDVFESILQHPRVEKDNSSKTVVIVKADIETLECRTFLGSKEIFQNPDLYIPYIFMEWEFIYTGDNGERKYYENCDEKLLVELTQLLVRSGYEAFWRVNDIWTRLKEEDSDKWPIINVVLWKHKDTPPRDKRHFNSVNDE